MIINKTVYTIGDIGNVESIAQLMRQGESRFEYFVYTTKNEKRPLCIGNFHALTEETEPIILGIAPSRRLARKLSVHIAVKALAFGEGIDGGIKRLIG